MSVLKALRMIEAAMPGTELFADKVSDWSLADKAGMGTAWVKNEWLL